MVVDIVLTYLQGRGGLEDVITKVSNGLKNKGHRVRIFLTCEPEYKEWLETVEEVYLYDENTNLNNMKDVIEGYQTKLKELGPPNVVMATHAPALSYVCNKALECYTNSRPNIISWIHGSPSYYGNENLLNYSDIHFAISNNIEESIKSITNNESNIYNIGNPVNLDEFKLKSQSLEKLRFVYIGRLENYQKRIDVLFKALSLLNCEWDLYVVGDGADEVELKKLAKKLNIDNNIQWLGWQENPWDKIDNITALILPSDEEAFGLVLVEALGRGIPVIASDCDGPIEIIKNDENGWLFERGNYKQLYKIIRDIQYGDKVIPTAEKCIESIQRFNEEAVIDRIEELLNLYNKEIKYIHMSRYESEDLIEFKYRLIRIDNNLDLENSLNYIMKYGKKDKQFFIDDLKYLLDINVINKLEVLNLIAIHLFKFSEIEMSLDVFMEALKFDRNNVDTVYNMSYVLYNIGEYELCEQVIKNSSIEVKMDEGIHEIAKLLEVKIYE